MPFNIAYSGYGVGSILNKWLLFDYWDNAWFLKSIQKNLEKMIISYLILLEKIKKLNIIKIS